MGIEEMNLPKLGFGMMRLPELDGKIDLERVSQMVDTYMQSGMNYFDTAYMYHNGTSELAVKQALVDRYPRESFFLTNKLPEWMMEGGKEGRDRILNDQLEKTGAGYFDIYLLHSLEDGEKYQHYEEYDCFNWAMEKKREGKIRHFGFSFHGTPELLDEVLKKHPEVEVVQVQLNYADWENPFVQSRRVYEVLQKYHKPILVMEPVKGGTLAKMDPDVEQIFKTKRPEASIASWALRFVGSLPGVVTVLSGMSTQEQMEDNIRTFQNFVPLSEQEKEAVWEVAEAMTARPSIACTACRYCVDGCPQGILIPDVFKSVNTLRIVNEEWRAKKYYKSLVEKGAGRAESCVQCGQCESVCPQHLSIIELLQEAAASLDQGEE